MIRSSDNARIKRLRALFRDPEERDRRRRFVIEGTHLLQTALAQKLMPERVFVPAGKISDPELSGCLKHVPDDKIDLVDDKILAKINGLTTGVAVVAEMARDLPASVPARDDCVVLERVQDPGNLGTILRSVAAVGMSHVLVDAGCCDVFSPKVLRAGMGAHFFLNIVKDADILPFLRARRGSLKITALHRHHLVDLYETDLKAPTTWVFGNEGAGVSSAIADLAPFGVRIPMSGPTESLNVAMAATVCLFEQQRARRYKKP